MQGCMFLETDKDIQLAHDNSFAEQETLSTGSAESFGSAVGPPFGTTGGAVYPTHIHQEDRSLDGRVQEGGKEELRLCFLHKSN